MTAGNMDCSTECSLDGTRRAILRVQYSTEEDEYRQCMEDVGKTDTEIRQNTAGERITK
jgi:hypothetical protein